MILARSSVAALGVIVSLVGALPVSAAQPLERFEIPLPGRRLAAVDDGGNGRLVVLLRDEVADGDEDDEEAEAAAPRRLAIVDFSSGEPALVVLPGAVPAGADDLALLDVDADGTSELLVSGETAIHSLGRPHAGGALADPVELWRGLGASLSAVRTPEGRAAAARSPRAGSSGERSLAGRSPGLAVARAGQLEVFAVDGEGELRRRASHRLPVKADLRQWGLLLESPPVTDLGGGRYAVGPAEHGQRLATELIGGADADGPSTSWSRLPGVELLQQGWVELVDGEPVLAVTTLEKMGIFVKLQLRLFPLVADESRAGRAPSFATATDANMWFEVDTVFRDLDGDGKDDLVVLHPEGMGGGDLEIAAYRGLGGGRFESRGEHTKRKLEDGDFTYGGDVTGDGAADLVIETYGRLVVYGAERGKKALKVVSKRPLWELDLDAAGGSRQVSVEVGGDGGDVDVDEIRWRDLEVLDVDADGVDEILVWGRGESADHLTVIRTSPSG